MTTERLISIVDCELCVAIQAREHVEAPPLPDTWTRLSTVATLPTSDAEDCEEVRMCPSCGAYYDYSQIHDNHSGEPRPATTEWYLSRITPHWARVYLLRDTHPQRVSAPSQLELLEKRYPAIIELLCRDLARSPNLHVKKYMVDSLYDHFVFEEPNWNGLKTTLIDQPDPAIRVYVARSLLDDLYPDPPFYVGRSQAARRLLDGEPARKKLLVAVLADGLSLEGEFLMWFTCGYDRAGVTGMAMHALRYVVRRQNLAAAIPALITELQQSSNADWWREAARDLLIGYVGQDRRRAKKMLEATAPGTAEAIAVREHCQKVRT